MIKYIENGDIFTSETQCLINPVNCIGISGKGLALEFKQRFPDMFTTYRKMCMDGTLRVGQIGFYAHKKTPAHVICLFPTKNHWREPSTVDILDRTLTAFVKYAPIMKITSAAFPKIGCGLGGLHFKHQVQPLIEQHLGEAPFEIEVYI